MLQSKCSKMKPGHIGQQTYEDIFSAHFQQHLRSFRTSAISKLEGSEQFSAAGTFYVLGTFAALALGIATMFVRTLPLQRGISCFFCLRRAVLPPKIHECQLQKGPFQKERIVFQAAFFSNRYLLVFREASILWFPKSILNRSLVLPAPSL